MVNFALPILGLLAFICGPSNDLLDYLPVKNYWQIKQVDVTQQNMAGELVEPAGADAGPLIDQLSDADPNKRAEAKSKLLLLGGRAMTALRGAVDAGDPQTFTAAKELLAQIAAEEKPKTVRRLMAIRALGESGDASAVAILEPLTHSTVLFEADYAAAAIAQIQHHPTTRPAATLDERTNDAWHLPEDCAVVIQSGAFLGHPIALDSAFTQAAAPAHEPKEQLVDTWSRSLVDIADKVGNLRVQGITIGISGHAGPASGFIVVDVRGQYDSLAVKDWMVKQYPNPHMVGTTPVFGSEIFWNFIPDGNHLAVILGPPGVENHFDEIVPAVEVWTNDLHASTDLAPVLAKVDMSQPLWGVGVITPQYKLLTPELAAFDAVALESRLGEDHLLHIKLLATGGDPNGATATVGTFNGGVQSLLALARPAMGGYPFFAPVVKVLESVHCDANGGNATMTVEMPPSLFQAMVEAGDSAAGGATTQPAGGR